mmetsp:Transcript_139931/g.257688  ORF Transcript_139931/g.257688 Transcript_139931/m.257688 type:complete len:119 (+) Transcript_139931:3-359(+)
MMPVSPYSYKGGMNCGFKGGPPMKGKSAPLGSGPRAAVGEIRFDGQEAAASVDAAVSQFNGASIGDVVIRVVKDQSSQDGSKVIVCNLPIGYPWQELKDQFGQFGRIAYCNVKNPPGS